MPDSRSAPRPVLLPSLAVRADLPELMDAEGADRAILWQTLRELEVINRWLGGYTTTFKGLDELLPGASGRQREWSLLDVGCGGGDSLRVVADWARSRGYRFRLTGVDLQPDCLAYAKAHSQGYAIDWIEADYRTIKGHYDIILSSQFCHHLDDAQLTDYFRWLRSVARYGYLINDLQRHRLAYHSIHALTALFSRSAFVRYDGPLSVRRAFRHGEIAALAACAGLHPRIQWQWAFRYLVTGYV